MFQSIFSRRSPPRVVALDNHVSPSLIGSPPGSALRASSNDKTKTAKKEKKKTAREEKKTAREEKKVAAAKKKGRFESDSESSDSSCGQAKARVQKHLDAKAKAKAEKQEGSSASSEPEHPLYVEVNEGQRFLYLRR